MDADNIIYRILLTNNVKSKIGFIGPLNTSSTGTIEFDVPTTYYYKDSFLLFGNSNGAASLAVLLINDDNYSASVTFVLSNGENPQITVNGTHVVISGLKNYSYFWVIGGKL